MKEYLKSFIIIIILLIISSVGFGLAFGYGGRISCPTGTYLDDNICVPECSDGSHGTCPFDAPILATTTVSSCGGKIGLSWNQITDAIGYKIFKNSQQIATVISTYFETVAGVDDLFSVRAFSLSQESVDSNIVSSIPTNICIEAPILHVSTASTCGGKISLSWNEIIGATGYKIFKNDNQIALTTNNKFEVIAMATDIFTIKTVSTLGESLFSNSDSAVPSNICPLSNIVLTAITSNSCGEKIYLSWNKINEASEYLIFKNNNQILTTPNTYIEIKATEADVFFVKAVLPFEDSESSNPVSAIPSRQCDCLGILPDNNFEICPNTRQSDNYSWTRVSLCSVPASYCEYQIVTEDPENIVDINNENPENIININSIDDTPQFSTTTIVLTTENVINEVKKLFESETGSVVTKIVTTAGVVNGGVVVTGALAGTTATDLFFLPIKLWGLLLSAFGLKRRNRPWGTVYDSVTKQPIDPAYVTLTNLDTKEENTSITDLDGRYGFLVSPGRYTLSAAKTNYTFPSKKLFGKNEDELYTNLYFGDEIIIETDNTLINKNIPLDPDKFDWNEFVKGKKKLMRFYSKRKKILNILSDWLFRIGFVISMVSLFLVPAPYNLVIFILYILLVILRRFGLKQKALGSLTEEGGDPLSFAIIRVFDSELNVEITNKVADKIGRYYCLVSKGKYYVKVEKKNDDESYSTVHTSEIFEAKDGIINKNFII